MLRFNSVGKGVKRALQISLIPVALTTFSAQASTALDNSNASNNGSAAQQNTRTEKVDQRLNMRHDQVHYTGDIIVKYKDSALMSMQESNTLQGVSINAAETMTQSLSAKIGTPLTLVRSMSGNAKIVRAANNNKPQAIQHLVRQLQNDARVEYAVADRMWQKTSAVSEPNDPRYYDQWHYQIPSSVAGGMNLQPAWNATTSSMNTVVAVLDTGILSNHPDLNDTLLPGYDMISHPYVANEVNNDQYTFQEYLDNFGQNSPSSRDNDPSDPGDYTLQNQCDLSSQPGPDKDSPSSWHGSHTAGTVAAETGNGVGVAGVGWNSAIVPVRVLGRCGGSTQDIIDGIRWAAGLSVANVPDNPNPADVINMSLGGPGACDPAYQSAINDAVNAGTVVVVAAGNSTDDVANYSPASCDNVISVAATRDDGGLAYYSNYGSKIDVSAPGGSYDVTLDSQGQVDTVIETRNVLSTVSDGEQRANNMTYGFSQGTSMAAPHIAGLAALIRSVAPDYTPAQIEQHIKQTARSFPSVSRWTVDNVVNHDPQCNTSRCGSGLADAGAAINDLIIIEPEELQNGVPLTGLSGAKDSENHWSISIPAGAQNINFAISGGSGDADLYVRKGSEPSQSNYDCRPWKGGNSEQCSYNSSDGDTYFIMIHGYQAYSGLQLLVTYDEPCQTNCNTSLNESNLSTTTGNWLYYQVEVNAGSSALDVAISGGSGDADLYVRYGNQPTSQLHDCRPYKYGNQESCSISNPAAGTWHIGVRAYSSFSGLDLTASW